jgi:hypothetical protein
MVDLGLNPVIAPVKDMPEILDIPKDELILLLSEMEEKAMEGGATFDELGEALKKAKGYTTKELRKKIRSYMSSLLRHRFIDSQWVRRETEDRHYHTKGYSLDKYSKDLLIKLRKL